jgi:hypothetical protein
MVVEALRTRGSNPGRCGGGGRVDEGGGEGVGDGDVDGVR